MQKVRAGYVSPSTDNVLLPIAQKRGLLAQHGIEVEIIALRGGVQMAQALLSDSLQFAQMAGSVVVRSVLAGGDLVMIAGFVNRISYLMVSRPNINSMKDLTGKKIATASIGGSVDSVLRLGLKASGIDPQQATLLPAGPPNARIAALASGQMDATIVLPENLGAVEKAGLKVLKDLSEVDLQIQHTGLVVRRSLIKENRNLVKSVLAAIVEAINFYRGNERETIEIMGAFAGTRDARPLLDSYKFHKRLFQQPPYPSPEGFKTVLAEIRDPAIDEKKVRSEQFFDRTLLDELKAK
ncbi:MAG: NitT/TauT family transport system substrate-binding protein [Candidatus Binatota bacterium]|nr:NitT/TauT family transport system substrate-binding protein [Candidatus Binatota bacterium]